MSENLEPAVITSQPVSDPANLENNELNVTSQVTDIIDPSASVDQEQLQQTQEESAAMCESVCEWLEAIGDILCCCTAENICCGAWICSCYENYCCQSCFLEGICDDSIWIEECCKCIFS
ncbi:unnamed protein product [Chrysodeixis includens]|uniref:Uncharacterized protein n=1 Tax=Chrysodeixis includens TaxID=689277 RepID=A0A9P0BZ75_CHRIL|nr:unnamed protein product [Chrysodeixis includens]